MRDDFLIVPTVVPKDAADFVSAVEIVKVFTDRIHLDIDDGAFASPPSWPFLPSGEFMPFNLSSCGVAIEAHLMTKDPRSTGDMLASAGAKLIIAHIEAFGSTQEALDAFGSWRAAGAEVGIAILMQTPLEALAPVVGACDFVQAMCIDVVGAQGAPFDPRAVARIGQIHTAYPNALIGADGGVSPAKIVDLARVGVRRFSIGTAIMKQPNPTASYASLRATLANMLR